MTTRSAAGKTGGGGLALARDGRLLFAARALRTFFFGWLSVILALYLARQGLAAGPIGGVFTATMVEDAALTVVLSSVATGIGSRRVMAWASPLMTLGGLLLAVADSPRVLVIGAVLGTLSPNGQEAGVTSSARAISQSIAPSLSGVAMTTAGTGLPFLVAGSLKIVYDLAMYARFRTGAPRS